MSSDRSRRKWIEPTTKSQSRPSWLGGDPVLAAGHEVHLDPEPEVGLLAHERAVGVEVVVRRMPERVVPDLQRGAEAVDVLGDPELRYPALGRRLAVALGVGGREGALEGMFALVRAQMDVVVGQQAAARRSGGRAGS